jgi:hypothetical protein
MTDLARVKPGDLITADFINGLIDSISDLQGRVSHLEGGLEEAQSVKITAFEPPPPPDGTGQALGQVLRIHGVNFAFPPTNNKVRIQNFSVSSGGLVEVTQFHSVSSTILLEFVIPTAIAGIQATGSDVTITIENTNGKAQKTYRLKPALPQTTPPPVITSVTEESTGLTGTIGIGNTAAITGQNFSTTPADNKIAFIFELAGGTTVRYPDVNDPTIQVISAEAAKIRFNVPNMTQVGTAGRTATLEVKVGNNPGVQTSIFVYRPV